MRAIVLALVLLLGPVTLHAGKVIKLPSSKELTCLIRNVYHEARGEAKDGKVAVALVTLNRTKHKNYPSSICGVVYQHKQFSWTINKSRAKINVKEWYESVEASIEAIRGKYEYFDATHYHNHTVSPKWGLTKIATIGGHIFYK